MPYTKNPNPKTKVVGARVKEPIKELLDQILKKRGETKQGLIEGWVLCFVNENLRENKERGK